MSKYCLSKPTFGDVRLDKRYHLIIKSLSKFPAASIPQAMLTSRASKATYRFISNTAVSSKGVKSVAARETVQAIAKCKSNIVLIPQDSTSLNYNTLKSTSGLGYLNNYSIKRPTYGIHMHTAFALQEDGLPLGVVSQEMWVRSPSRIKTKRDARLPIEKKESFKWLKAISNIEKLKLPDNKTYVVMGDRESDIFELFTKELKTNTQLLIRSTQNRQLVCDKKTTLHPHMSRLPVIGHMAVQVKRRSDKPARKARLEVRYDNVVLTRRDRREDAVALTCIYVKEIDYPKSKDPINWMLLSTIPVVSMSDAVTQVGWYAKRWMIERFHYTLKSGCRIEQLQFETRKRLEKAILLYSTVATKLLKMTYYARLYPEASPHEIFSKQEVRLLKAVGLKRGYIQKKESNNLKMKSAIMIAARLGGFQGRKGDGDPGVKTLWLGIKSLHDMIVGWRLNDVGKKDVGNG